MVLTLNVIKTDDGFEAIVPSVRGCETWAANEDDAIEKILDLLKYYIKLPEDKKLVIDKAAQKGNKGIYKILFQKP
ncbi:MAG: hypothetical protein WC055_03145 [Melioribacteraceae bacterium]